MDIFQNCTFEMKMWSFCVFVISFVIVTINQHIYSCLLLILQKHFLNTVTDIHLLVVYILKGLVRHSAPVVMSGFKMSKDVCNKTW